MAATQEQKTNERQEKREPQSSALARLGGYDPFGFFLNPYSLMRRMTEEMDRAFGQSGFGPGIAGTAWMPAIEVSERDGKYTVRAELPGLKPENVKVSVEDGNLVLEGERKFEQEDEKGGVHRTERRYGKFYRSIPLPEGANLEQANAKFDNGVLEVVVPTPQQSSARRQIPVETGGSGGGRKAA